MSVDVHITEGPLPARPPAWRHENAGAVVCFEGMVRPREGEHRISALDYDVYEPMAAEQLQRLAEEQVQCRGLIGACVEHSRGRVGVGQCSFRLRLASTHRKEAIAAMDVFIDRMKQDVPIWKKPVLAAKPSSTGKE